MNKVNKKKIKILEGMENEKCKMKNEKRKMKKNRRAALIAVF